MKVAYKVPPNLGWTESKLDQEHIDFLWKRMEEGGDDYKGNLAGNISKSFKIKDKDNYFFNNVLGPCVHGYIQNAGAHAVKMCSLDMFVLDLTSFWCNYQYQTEFNPSHEHSSAYSFVVWMKIPYDYKEQCKLPHLDGLKDKDKKPGCFEFEYTNNLGQINNCTYPLNSSCEGVMLLFPGAMRHCVYPFYNTDEPRISLSGNLTFELDNT